MLMKDASLNQRIPCIIRISIFGAFSARKKCALYTGKYGISGHDLCCTSILVECVMTSNLFVTKQQNSEELEKLVLKV